MSGFDHVRSQVHLLFLKTPLPCPDVLGSIPGHSVTNPEFDLYQS